MQLSKHFSNTWTLWLFKKKKNWRGSKLESKSPSAGKRGINAKLTLEEEFFMVLTRLRCGLA